MAAFFTGNRFRTKGRVQFTEKVFLGRLCERLVAGHCRRRGWKVLKKNWRFKRGEIDLLAEDSQGNWIVVEVRGRREGARQPSAYFPETKRRRLKRLAESLAFRYARPVRLELVEVIGNPPQRLWARLGVWLLARWMAPGFRLRVRALD